MITFQKIRWKNFLSTGNQFTEVELNQHKTNLVVGTNGAGKSTILDALTFALFNKPYRKINKPQLINTTNERECVVEIEFTINTRQYLVRRGIKPSVFDIIVNGTPLHREADDRAMQRILEESILKLNYKSFTQIVILGSSTFVPFMQLTSSNRREVIEDLLDIRIFSAMNNILKDNIKEKKSQVKSLDLKKDTLKDKMKMQKDFIEELENRGHANINANKEKISSLDKEVDVYMKDNATIEEQVHAFTKEQNELIDAGKKLVKLNNLRGKISQKVSTITKEHKFFTENTVCPTCTQSIEEEFRLNRISNAQNKAKELKEGYEELENTIKFEQERERQFTALSQEITSLTHGISQNNTRISLNQRQIRDLEHEIQTITENLANRNSEHEKISKRQSKTFQTKNKKSFITILPIPYLRTMV
jgi:DNA repair exonuclease SbcCD ATPase subunit